MKILTKTLAVAGLLALVGGAVFMNQISVTPAYAGNQSVTASQEQSSTFKIENMTCATCPITVRKAIEGVKGIASVNIDFEAKTATVIFDPTQATRIDIANASTNAGYPASEIKN